ncbi:MAG: hypothetical protein KJ044_17220, partial [Planctomycetes bacterium]|nr:hypothetical protein [Planctomycetota bacterium]
TIEYALNELNTSANKFGEGGHINMVKKEKATAVKINVHDAYEGAPVTADVAETLVGAGHGK